MKRILNTLCLVGATVVGSQAIAQQAAPPPTPAERREERREDRRELQRKEDERRQERREEVRENREIRDENRAEVREHNRELRHGSSDEQIAAVILAGCNNEVRISQLAKDHLQSQAAKDFADRMIREHQAQCDKLHKLAGVWGSDYTGAHRDATRPDVKVDVDAPRTNVEVPRGVVAPPPAAPGKAAIEIGNARLEINGRTEAAGPRVAVGAAVPAANQLDWVSIHQQIADECYANAQRELSAAESKQHADECYIGWQIAAHGKMAEELKVLAKYASPGLREQLETARQTAESHLKLAKATMESLEKGRK